MKTIREIIEEAVTQSLKDINSSTSEVDFAVDYTKESKFGDYSTNVAMQLAKKQPIKVAEEIISSLKKQKELKGIIEKIEVIKEDNISRLE